MDKKVSGIHEGYPIKGHVKLVLIDKNGKVKDVREGHNTITVAHDALVAASMVKGEAGDALINYMEVGTATLPTGKSTASTTLEAYLTGRVQNNSNTQGLTTEDNDVIHVATFGAGISTGAIGEAGLFTGAGENEASLQAFQDFAVINKGAGDTLTVTWTISYGAS